MWAAIRGSRASPNMMTMMSIKARSRDEINLKTDGLSPSSSSGATQVLQLLLMLNKAVIECEQAAMVKIP